MLMLTVLFVAAAVFALATIVTEVRRYAGQAVNARQELRRCPETREFRFKVIELKVLRGTAQVHVLPVKRAAARPQPLRAAA